ncbi:MAG: topoisomerase C-terminal repeat-containing protein, partial [Nitrosospira sp.]
GKTDLLPKFISKKGRPFSAYLVTGADGKVGFEFEPRETKTKTKTTVATAETKVARPKSKASAIKKSAVRKP